MNISENEDRHWRQCLSLFHVKGIVRKDTSLGKKRKKKQKRNPVAVACSTIGTILLIILVLVCIPLTIPRMIGYNIYTVVSGSMEPAIPTGSLVYINNMAPEEVQKDDVIAFYGATDGSSIITHRVVTNSTIMGEFITKGDANEENDMNPIPYSHFIGKVVLSVPKVGGLAQTFTSMTGKIAAASMIVLAIVLHLIAAAVGGRGEQE